MTHRKKKECGEQRIYRGTGRKKEYELFLSLLCVPVTAVLLRSNFVIPSGRFNLTTSPARKRIERSKEKVRNEEACAAGRKTFTHTLNRPYL